MTNDFFLPYTSALRMGTEISAAVWNNWLQLANNGRLKQEAALQRDLILRPSESEDCYDMARAAQRLKRISPAARAFLARHIPMTTLAEVIPSVRDVEQQLARRAVHSIQVAEHAVRSVLTPRVSLAEWRATRSYGDELSELASNDPVVYQMMATMDTLPQDTRRAVAQQLCEELKSFHAEHHQQLQMG